jgi:hypothetical protein
MFSWYAGAEICYVYLADYDVADPGAEMSKSRYFTRGWTLQELIAPARVQFHDKSWNLIGTKDVLSQQLSLITGIGQEILLASKHRRLEQILDQIPIAQRMSWAARRETTRIEDMAYCLFGIFGINLPTLYGEGDRAFLRLQEELVKSSNDLSLLAWLSPKPEPPTDIDHYCGVFAQHPRQFQSSDRTSLINDMKFTPDFTLTNKGLKIQTELYFSVAVGLHILNINCQNSEHPEKTLGIYLKHQGASVFARARPHLFALIKDADSVTENRSIFLSKIMMRSVAESLNTVHACSFMIHQSNDAYQSFVAAIPENLWDGASRMFITGGLKDFVGSCEYKVASGKLSRFGGFERSVEMFLVIFGYGYGLSPWIRILPSDVRLHNEMKHANWRKVAQDMNFNNSKSLVIGWEHDTGLRKSWRRYVDVQLEHGVKRGEPVYSVEIKSKFD